MPKQISIEDIQDLSVFQGLEPQELTLMSRSLRRKEFPAGQTLLYAGESSGVVHILLSGTVKVCAEGDKDGDLPISHCGPGEVLGDMSAMDGQGHSASVIALEATVAGSLSGDDFLQHLHDNPRFSMNVMLGLVRRVRLATVHFQSMAVDDVMGRVARQLLAFVQSHGQPNAEGEFLIPFRLTQHDLASMVGASRPRVQQALAAFEDSGSIRTGRCPLTEQPFRITVRSPEALKARCFQHQNS